jgi:single-stranded-DNA-specific exonuclease
MLRQVFGDRVEVNLLDLAPELWKAFPALADKSLLRLRQSSRMAIYGTQAPSEIDVLRSLFTLFVHRKEPSLSSEYRKSLDLVAVATLADMMPLHDENRILVRQGLAQLSDDPNKGLRELISRRGLLGKQLAAVDIAWQISPIVNAAGRMGSPERSVELLLASDLAEVQRIASEVVELNEARRRIGEEGWDRVIARAYESFQESGERMVYVADEGLQRGVTGIIAGRLARHFNVPAVVIAVLGERAVGSVRAMRGFGVTDFLRTLDDLLDDWGGHDAAGGFQLDASRLEGFFARLASAAPGIELSPEQEERIPIDAEIPHEYLEPKLQEVVAIFQPFGQENGPLHFLTRNMRIEQLDFIGRPDPKHVKFLLSAGKYKWPALFWNAAERAGKDFNVNEAVDVVFRLEKNFFQSRETLQLNVVDLKRSGS